MDRRELQAHSRLTGTKRRRSLASLAGIEQLYENPHVSKEKKLLHQVRCTAHFQSSHQAPFINFVPWASPPSKFQRKTTKQ